MDKGEKMTYDSLRKNLNKPLTSVVSFFYRRVQNSFKARSYDATVRELSRMPESMLKNIGMDHSNVSAKTYELVYGKH